MLVSCGVWRVRRCVSAAVLLCLRARGFALMSCLLKLCRFLAPKYTSFYNSSVKITLLLDAAKKKPKHCNFTLQNTVFLSSVKIAIPVLKFFALILDKFEAVQK